MKKRWGMLVGVLLIGVWGSGENGGNCWFEIKGMLVDCVSKEGEG